MGWPFFTMEPVVMFSTAYSQDITYEQHMADLLYKIGAQDFIRKPNDFVKLKQIIHNTLIMVTEKKMLFTQGKIL